MLVVMDKEPLHPRLQELTSHGFHVKVWKDTNNFGCMNLKLSKGLGEWHYLFTPDDWKDFLDFKAVEPKMLVPNMTMVNQHIENVLDYFKPKTTVTVPGHIMKPGDHLTIATDHGHEDYTVLSVKGPTATVKKAPPSLNDLKTQKKSWEMDVMNHPQSVNSQAQQHMQQALQKLINQGQNPKMLIGFDPIQAPEQVKPTPFPPQTSEFVKQYLSGISPEQYFDEDVEALEKYVEMQVKLPPMEPPKPPFFPKSYAEIKGMGGKVPAPAAFMGELEAVLHKRGIKTSRPEVRAALEHLKQVCATAVEEEDRERAVVGRFVDLSDET